MNAITFKELNLIDPIQRAIEAEKYTIPTPIQVAAIPHLLAGRDLLACAQTGTGKTAAFALPILQLIDQNRQAATPRAVRVLVLSPTRELRTRLAAALRCMAGTCTFAKRLFLAASIRIRKSEPWLAACTCWSPHRADCWT